MKPLEEGQVLGNYYKLPDQKALLIKSKQFMISKSKNRDCLAELMKSRKDMPGPTQYNVGLSMVMKKNIGIYKKERTSFCDDIIKQAKQTPGVGTHNPVMKEKVKGLFKR